VSASSIEKRRYFDNLAPRWDEIKPAAACAPGVERGLALVEPLAGRTVVDVGCGLGLLEAHLLPRVGQGRVIAVDFAPEMIARARARHPSPRIEWLCRDVFETGIADTVADVVLCFNAFPHFPDRPATLAEWARWLKPAGSVLIWHDTGREQLAGIHAGADPAIRCDRLPPVVELASLARAARLSVERAEEDDHSYTLLAHRP
jgi:demethylmenaquinone methyltransferase/2-methoxy-6-polyprenyl-1,4-benzoquinol methylase